MNEKRLIRKLQERDSQAATEFVDTYGARVHALARRYARTEADAEDLTQEIFVELCRAIASFRGDSQLSTWVYRVALNRCLKHRDRAKPESLPLEDERLAVTQGNAPDPANEATRAELSTRVDSALAKLSPEHRDVVLLHELHGMTYSECADLLGIPIGTVKSRLSNAFRRLRMLLYGYVFEAETPGLAGMTPALALRTKGDAR